MIVHKMPLGAYQTNTYLLANDTEAVVIDPGYEADTILDALAGKTLKAILLTHGHFDHVGAVKELVAETGCEVWIHAAESTMPPMVTAGPLYFTHTYDEGDTVSPIAGLELTVLHTPGHTPGSVCLLMGKAFRVVDGSRDITQYYETNKTNYEAMIDLLIDGYAGIV